MSEKLIEDLALMFGFQKTCLHPLCSNHSHTMVLLTSHSCRYLAVINRYVHFRKINKRLIDDFLDFVWEEPVICTHTNCDLCAFVCSFLGRHSNDFYLNKTGCGGKSGI
jgi:hypothetical protein